jgi:ubiquinone/menaquinone biosynthesis C-methylase UbiE
MIHRLIRLLPILMVFLFDTGAFPTVLAQPATATKDKRKTPSKEERQQRDKSLRAIAQRLGIGPGSAIADIGAGNGPDVWVFADIVGTEGKVFAEEIDEGKTKAMAAEAGKRNLPQVQVVLGRADDPTLPANRVDMAFMHLVYHHFAQPREMLQGIWKSLKPGGYLVIVDQRLGTLTDWVPRTDRATKHYWIAETTVVREAREQGYLFAEYAEQCWHTKNEFVLVFHRPKEWPAPVGDPDPLPPIPAGVVEQLLPKSDKPRPRVAFVALGEGRQLIETIRNAVPCDAVDIVLEEWATQKDERPPLPAGISLPSALTEQGDPHLGPEAIDAVYFFDSYHLLFHAPTLLAQLRERLAAAGRIFVLDRRAAKDMPRREASHRRMVAPETVKQEMSQAGFQLVREEPQPADGRFLLVFGKADEAAAIWQFDKEGDLQGWTAGGHVRDVRVADGVLSGETSDWDPILIGPVFDVVATPTQRVEICLKTPRGGSAQLFWTETLQGQYGGFSQEKCCEFNTRSSDEYQIYRIPPFWHAAGRIVRLRLDPPATGQFAIKWIRIVDDATSTPTESKAWQFTADLHGWRAWQEVSGPTIQSGRLHVKSLGKSPILMSPLLSVAASENPYVSVRMAVTRGSGARLFCVSDTQFGSEQVSFPLRADGKVHSYNVDVGHLAQWRDRIVMLGIQPTDAEGAEVAIESIEIADGPRGPAELEVAYFGPAEGVNRAGRPVDVLLSVRNLGGSAAQEVAVTLSLPTGLRALGPQQMTIQNLTPWLPQTVTWKIESAKPQQSEIAVNVECPAAGTLSATTAVAFSPVPSVPATTYIPEPQPVKSPYEIGVFYFPGWPTMSRWQPILDYPMRKPALGWYDEANPECADWQIKWAVEHGVTFFMVDWYWCQGNRHLEHWVHSAYMKARFRKYLKWAVMWANHNPPHTHSSEDWQQVTRYWIENYFGMEEYYRIDGRPAVFIWSPGGIRNDVGGSAKAAELYAMSQRMARDAGLPGIYFVAMSGHESAAAARQLQAEGYEACTSYHGFQLAEQRAGSRRFPFADVVDTSPQVWREADERCAGLLYLPIADTGWASEPWHGNKSLVISERTPEQFGRLCQAARKYADETQKKIIAIGPWNEWGEGSYIEPYAEHGFGDLDAMRAAFCPPGNWPPNLIPSDVGRGPYDLPQLVPQTEWHFNVDGNSEEWTANGYLNIVVKNGMLSGKTTGNDPILNGPGVQMEADRMRHVKIRMRADAEDQAQLFWATSTSSQSEGNSLRFRVTGDGQYHEYELDMSKSPGWRGLITSLRFDPANKPGTSFEIDYMRFH